MEKLQKALEKARATRLARKLPIELNSDGAPDESLRPKLESWEPLTEIKFDPAVLERNKIIAFQGGPAATYYDILRTRLRDECKRRDIKRVAITSTRPQAGKSTTLANLAFSFGRLPFHRTMIFDFDLRRPSMHKLLGQTPRYDMGQVLRGEVRFDDHILRHGDNLAFGFNAQPVVNPSELLQSERTLDFLAAVDETYFPDLMLFDMPPFLAADDAHGFLSSIDGVLLVVEAERTTRAQLDMVEQKLSELSTVIGVVLNKCNFPDETDVGAYGYEYN
ncbi:MAG: CpsD/CapB family tyrosine-protein kinase [Sphingomonadales bacterium]|nr:CpsD/CapB family tyrosine-protein kinase [Sphingomonadales bacterium]